MNQFNINRGGTPPVSARRGTANPLGRALALAAVEQPGEWVSADLDLADLDEIASKRTIERLRQNARSHIVSRDMSCATSLERRDNGGACLWIKAESPSDSVA